MKCSFFAGINSDYNRCNKEADKVLKLPRTKYPLCLKHYRIWVNQSFGSVCGIKRREGDE